MGGYPLPDPLQYPPMRPHPKLLARILPLPIHYMGEIQTHRTASYRNYFFYFFHGVLGGDGGSSSPAPSADLPGGVWVLENPGLQPG